MEYDDSFPPIYHFGHISCYDKFVYNDQICYYNDIYDNRSTVDLYFPTQDLLDDFLDEHYDQVNVEDVICDNFEGWVLTIYNCTIPLVAPTPPQTNTNFFSHPDELLRLDEAFTTWAFSLCNDLPGKKILLEQQLRLRISRDAHVDLTSLENRPVRIYDVYHLPILRTPIRDFLTFLDLENFSATKSINATEILYQIRKQFLPLFYKPPPRGHHETNYDDDYGFRSRSQSNLVYKLTPNILERLVRTRRLELYFLFIFTGLLYYLVFNAPLAPKTFLELEYSFTVFSVKDPTIEKQHRISFCFAGFFFYLFWALRMLYSYSLYVKRC